MGGAASDYGQKPLNANNPHSAMLAGAAAMAGAAIGSCTQNPQAQQSITNAITGMGSSVMNSFNQQQQAGQQVQQGPSNGSQPSVNVNAGMGVSAKVMVVAAAFCVPKPTTLVLKEKFASLSGDDCTIKDESGQKVFKLDAKTISLRDSRTLEDSNGKPLVNMRKKMISLHGKWYGSTPEGKLLFTVSPKIVTLKPSVNVYLDDGDKDPDFTIKGSWRKKDFKIFDVRNGQNVLIAECNKTRSYEGVSAFVKTQILETDEYFITIQPGCDAAFISSLCLLLDEIYNEEDD